MTTIEICKKLYIENEVEFNNFVKVKALNENLIFEQSQIRAKDFYNLAREIKIWVKSTYNPSLAQKAKIDLSKILDKNLSDRLIKPI